MKKKIEKIEEVIIPFKYSPKVTLYPGDEFRCSGGPYWVTQKEGKKVRMGHSGLFRFTNSTNDGNIMATSKKGQHVFIYMGETKLSDSGTHLTAHTIKKCRKKKNG